jgi:hypothetical protein
MWRRKCEENIKVDNQGSLCGAKWSECESGNSPSFNTYVKITWFYISAPPFFFMLWSAKYQISNVDISGSTTPVLI